MNKKLTLTGVNKIFLFFSISFITYQIILGVIMGNRINDNLYTIILVNEIVFILAPVLIYCLAKGINIRETLRLNKPGLVPMLLVAVISLPAYFVAAMLNNVLLYFLQFIGDIPAQGIPVPQNPGELAVGLLIIAVVPGVCEEVMHRGLLLKAYEKRGSYKAVVIVSIFFGIFHFDITNFLGPVFLGLIIGYYVIRTNSIFAGMFAHFLNNAIAEILQYLYRDQLADSILTISWPELRELLVLGFASLIIMSGLMLLFKEATKYRTIINPPITTAVQDAKAILSHWPVILTLVIYIFMMMISLFMFAVIKYTGI